MEMEAQTHINIYCCRRHCLPVMTAYLLVLQNTTVGSLALPSVQVLISDMSHKMVALTSPHQFTTAYQSETPINFDFQAVLSTVADQNASGHNWIRPTTNQTNAQTHQRPPPLVVSGLNVTPIGRCSVIVLNPPCIRQMVVIGSVAEQSV